MVGNGQIYISQSNVLQTVLLAAVFNKYCQAAFGRCEY